jgi:hypothetical protein
MSLDGVSEELEMLEGLLLFDSCFMLSFHVIRGLL